ncbi:hypothetical protein NLJ89_g10425 [Agrocybe chaxingu]|uniref:Uncharacterized protein n=1 Tax=Agrocybe chaxingu TaxID=84603 RepID=A0A9W8JR65_9AGAR|nr:hypothetical protein NLJ89_g10425 [Agrocybe chaxingu]
MNPIATQPLPPTPAFEPGATQTMASDVDANINIPPVASINANAGDAGPPPSQPPTMTQSVRRGKRKKSKSRSASPNSTNSRSKRRKTQQMKTQQMTTAQTRSLSPAFIRDDKELREQPSLIPCLEKEGKEPLLITKTDAKKLYRLKDTQLAEIPVFRTYERQVPGIGRGEAHHVKVHLYREVDIEFAAWRVFGGYHRFLRYLLKRKSTYIKQQSKTKRVEDLEFPVSKFYKEPLEEWERAEAERAKLLLPAEENATKPAA